MLIQGDARANRFVVKALIEHECQFLVTFKNKRQVRVAFHEGTWRVMRENGDYVDIYDAPDTQDSNNSLLRGFVDEKIKTLGEKTYFDPCRQLPGEVVADTLAYWADKLENIEQIDVTQAHRDGWFKNFND